MRKGEPKTMQDNPRYDDVVLEVFDYLEARIAAAVAAGIDRPASPPIPASASARRSPTISRCSPILSLFHGLGVPLLIGASRKRFIKGCRAAKSPRSREPGLPGRGHRRGGARGTDFAGARRGGSRQALGGVAGAVGVRH